jgi:hypothetical protein
MENDIGRRIWLNPPLSDLDFIEANNHKGFDFTFDLKDIEPGEYAFFIGMKDGITELSVNSNKHKLLIPIQNMH